MPPPGVPGELLKERMVSLRMKKRVWDGIRANETRSKISNNMKALPDSFLYESLGHDNKRACQLESTRAIIHESMRVREDECSRARRYESMTS